jgi:penicillin-binding protein 2
MSLRALGQVAALRAPRTAGQGERAPQRFFRVQLLVVVAFVLLVGRLWHLQISSGDHYLRKSADNFVKELELPAPRGTIRDRQGAVLAENRPSYDVLVTPRFLSAEALQKLARIMRLSDDEVDALRAKVQARRGLDRLRPLVVFEDVTRDQVGLVESAAIELPGVAIRAGMRRHYRSGSLAAHVVGYLNQITAEELAQKREEAGRALGQGELGATNTASHTAYHAGDYIGRAGLERQWESLLHGEDGVERIAVDAKGQRKRDVEGEELAALLDGPQRVEPRPGLDLVVTLDLELQRATERALGRHRSAAAVVVEVQTGRILALASQPTFDPNLLGGKLSHADANALVHDAARPLIDKTVRENYFPGSTFKVVPALAGLLEHVISPEETIFCRGAIEYGRRWFHCVEPHAKVDLQDALAASCNVYFYGLGDRLGLERMQRVAEDLGFGAPTGLGINGEVAGLLPSVEFYKQQAGGFQKGQVLNTAIGQGSVKVTVLQLAMAYAAIANGGSLYVPQLIERIEEPGGRVLEGFKPRLRRRLASPPEDLARIRRALDDAVNDPIGTSYQARPAPSEGMQIAGKTGTAQVQNRRLKDADGTLAGDHAWFASFAPADAPEIAIVVLIEHGGFGAKAATPAAVAIYRTWYAARRKAAATASAPTGATGAAPAGAP